MFLQTMSPKKSLKWHKFQNIATFHRLIIKYFTNKSVLGSWFATTSFWFPLFMVFLRDSIVVSSFVLFFLKCSHILGQQRIYCQLHRSRELRDWSHLRNFFHAQCVVIFQHRVKLRALRENDPYFEFFWSKCWKIRTRKIPNTDTCHAVKLVQKLFRKMKIIRVKRLDEAFNKFEKVKL